MKKKKTTKNKRGRQVEEILKKRENFKKDIDYPEKLDMGGVNYIREDHIRDYVDSLPIEVREQILLRGKPKKWYNPFSWFSKGEEEVNIEGNLLFLLDDEMGLKVYENVPSGVFKVKQYAGTDRESEKYIVLKPNKLRTIRFDKEEKRDGKKIKKEEYMRVWVADINNPVALPEDPMYDCEEVGNLVRKAVSGTNDFNNVPKRGGLNWLKWVAIAGVVAYIIYLAMTKYHIGEWFDFSSAKSIAQNVVSGDGAVAGGTLNAIWLGFKGVFKNE